jgi:hypothetical protein
LEARVRWIVEISRSGVEPFCEELARAETTEAIVCIDEGGDWETGWQTLRSETEVTANIVMLQ